MIKKILIIKIKKKHLRYYLENYVIIKKKKIVFPSRQGL